jgi:hypothetical protein
MRLYSIRCSSLPLVMRCAAAAQQPALAVNRTSQQTELGTEVHTHLREMVETGASDWESIRNPEVRGLVGMGWRMWKELRNLFPDPLCEVSLSAQVGPVTLTGHTDVQSRGIGGTARVLDWKSGRVDTDYREQLLGYAALVLIDEPWFDRVETHIAWLRDEDIENYTLTRKQLPEWRERIASVAAWSGNYETGPHCGHCPLAHECPGFNAIVRSDVAALLDLDMDSLESGLATMAPQRVIEVVRRAKLVGVVAEKVREAARHFVATRGDITGDDARLTMQVEQRRLVDIIAAWPILERNLSDEELAGCVDVRLSRVNDAVTKKAPPRKGAAVRRALATELEEAGAISTREIMKLVERRKT